jgi:hypothetical protein
MLVQKITNDILPVQLRNFFPDFRGTNIILPLTALLALQLHLQSTQ